jgi:SAM-dependent methyltransferase
MELDYGYHYGKWHANTPEHAQGMREFYARLLGPHLPTNRDAEVLDVGCGMGFALTGLQALGFTRLQGVELDSGQAKSCRDRGLDVDLTKDTVSWLAARPERYDLVLALDLIEHIPHSGQIAFASALATCLKRKGRLICTVPNANSTLAARYRHIDWTHETSFTEHSIDFLLHHGGFGPCRIYESDTLQRPKRWWLPLSGSRHWWAFRFFRLWRRWEMMAELGPQQGRTIPLSVNLVVVAEKPDPAKTS